MIVRSKRRTMSIIVRADNSIVVRCPRDASSKRIDDFVARKRGWIEKKVRANSSALQFLEGLADCSYILVKGKKLPAEFGFADEITPDVARFRDRSHIRDTLVRCLSGEFLQLVEQISRVTALSARSVKFRSYKARWGCCDVRGNVEFNYKLLMLDKSLWEYVILHELCHTVCFNHSPAFYALMERFMPDYKTRRASLKKFAFLARCSF